MTRTDRIIKEAHRFHVFADEDELAQGFGRERSTYAAAMDCARKLASATGAAIIQAETHGGLYIVAEFSD